ncbi:hypothetical protein KIW84_058445 [Lathyrus oleraceus]|uniref:Uncharacterized protein n=1 Tax=Pisum sativum TaxID=3888 RepID=A0A9D5AQ95_PEA|nr:hypothetical protein KIW84_058445 [Pisum sativum]
MLLINNTSLELEWEYPSSSPPTPPSPLPISYGAGNNRYSFSASSTLSPPFSSPENLSLLHLPSVFSVDLQDPPELESKSTCLKDLFALIVVTPAGMTLYSDTIF